VGPDAAAWLDIGYPSRSTENAVNAAVGVSKSANPGTTCLPVRCFGCSPLRLDR
jgi:hypothetical protein